MGIEVVRQNSLPANNGTVALPTFFYAAQRDIGFYRPTSPHGYQVSLAMSGAELFNWRGANATSTDYAGLRFTAQNSGQGSLIDTISSAANEGLYVRSKGTGTLHLSSTHASGAVSIAENGEATTLGGNTSLGAHYFDISEIAVPTDPAANTVRIFNDSATSHLSLRTSAGVTLDIEAGITVPGSNTQVIFNDSGVWGADADFTWNKTTNTLTVTNIASGVVISGNSGLIITPAAGGSLLQMNAAATQGGNIRFPANVAAGLTLADSGITYYVINTQTGTDNVVGHSIRPATGISYASAAGSTYSLVGLTAATVTLTGGVGVTAMAGLMLNIPSPSVSSAAATTVTTASSVIINGPLPAGAGPVTFTNSIALDIPTYATNGTTASGLRVAAPSGAAANYAINVTSGSSLFAGLITGSLGLTITGAAVSLNASSNFATNINTGNSTGAVTIGNSAAGIISIVGKANTSATIRFNDGSSTYYNINTQTGTDNITIHSWQGAAQSFASAAGTTFHTAEIGAPNLTLTGGTGVTALTGIALSLVAPFVTSASATVITLGSTLHVAQPTGGGAGPVSYTDVAAITSHGNIYPDTDNTYNMGNATYRWALVRAATITSGDLKFENDWYFTEADRVGMGDGIALCRPDGSVAQVFA